MCSTPARPGEAGRCRTLSLPPLGYLEPVGNPISHLHRAPPRTDLDLRRLMAEMDIEAISVNAPYA